MDFDQKKHAEEILKMQQMLNQQFAKNILFFKKEIPEVAEKFSRHTPTDISLKLSDQGYLNLFNNKLNNKPVYRYDPQKFCQDFVDQFTKKPHIFDFTPQSKDALDAENILHISHMNRCVDILKQHTKRTIDLTTEKTCNLLILNGIGMGYIVPQMLELCDIKNLVIIEPHLDIFFASLFILDWKEVFSYFKQEGHSLKLIVGQSSQQSLTEFKTYLDFIGVYNAVNSCKIDHLSSKEMKEITDNFLDRLGIIFASSGYFDDEQVGLAHTIQNWECQIPPLRNHSIISKESLDIPVFIIGNGPSLDEAKDFLSKHQENAIYISCGTTIGSLYKMGIKPDIHIEMERTKPVIEWLETSTDSQYRDNILLLTLNTVHPDVFKLFDKKGMALKANDLGTYFISKYIKTGNYCVNLGNCNPTVGNTGLALAIALGFREVYLFGMDFGFSSGTQHHSKHSTHYSIDKQHTASLNLYKTDDNKNFYLKGNFQEQILTNATFKFAKISMEMCLSQPKSINCYNTSNGIYIEGTTPIKPNQIESNVQIKNKGSIVNNLFENYFYNSGIEKNASQEETLKDFYFLEESIENLKKSFSTRPKSIDQVQYELFRHHNILNSLKNSSKGKYLYPLIKGSITSFCIILNKALYLGHNQKDSIIIYKKVLNIYLDFLDSIKNRSGKRLLDIDNKTRNLDSKLIK
ncbi:6-hydroxymethylpterin diphosphokinase MptE-like protein [Neptuniibacter sp. QD72_48]|uniref:motility associated factor glycosyltransferase family protein n=1 Tax=unclassified Neptuniibacter TaxID=2630693 RepID=UPI0039F60273